MVHLLQCSSSSSVQILLFVFSILLTSSMESALSDARRLPVPEDKAVILTVDNKQEAAAGRTRGEMMTEGRRRRDLIGSRPPRCERVCMSCGHCEAVQVPIVPQEEGEKARAAAAARAAVTQQLTAAMFTYRPDGIANYKPLSWKCRCGGTILDP